MSCAAAVMSAMLDEGRRPVGGRSDRFTLEAFQDAFPQLQGYFTSPVSLPCLVDDDAGTLVARWDSEKRLLRICSNMPPTSLRTAFEMCKALQHAALARDDRDEGDGARDLLYKVISLYYAWSFVSDYVVKGVPPSYFGIVTSDDEELFNQWQDLNHQQRLSRMADSLARWDDPSEQVALLTPLSPLLTPVHHLFPTGDPSAKPLVPAGYHNLEAVRLRMLRAALEGTLDHSVSSAISSIRKRLAQIDPEGCPRPPACPPPELPSSVSAYFENEEALQMACSVLSSPPAEVRDARLKSLLELESAVHDLIRPRIGSITL
eukprot:Sspe_Gene.106282::Locus_83662_Transcript_1_1_Confidence_1.000_Length_1097::g.106282::m.106282